MLTYRSRVVWNVFVSKNKKRRGGGGALAATYTIFLFFSSCRFVNLNTGQAVQNESERGKNQDYGIP